MTSPITKWLPLIVGVARRYRNPRNRCGSYDFRDAPSALWEEKAVVDLGRLDRFWLPFVAFGCLELIFSARARRVTTGGGLAPAAIADTFLVDGAWIRAQRPS